MRQVCPRSGEQAKLQEVAPGGAHKKNFHRAVGGSRSRGHCDVVRIKFDLLDPPTLSEGLGSQ